MASLKDLVASISKDEVDGDAGDEDAGPFFTGETALWPDVRVTIHRAPKSMDEIDDFEAKFVAMLEKAKAVGSKLFIMFQADGIVKASVTQQFRASKLIGRVKPLVPDSIAATAIVVTSWMARMVLEAILSLVTLSSRNSVFDSTDAALKWLADVRGAAP
jgi:hypothetical protein